MRERPTPRNQTSARLGRVGDNLTTQLYRLERIQLSSYSPFIPHIREDPVVKTPSSPVSSTRSSVPVFLERDFYGSRMCCVSYRFQSLGETGVGRESERLGEKDTFTEIRRTMGKRVLGTGSLDVGTRREGDPDRQSILILSTGWDPRSTSTSSVTHPTRVCRQGNQPEGSRDAVVSEVISTIRWGSGQGPGAFGVPFVRFSQRSRDTPSKDSVTSRTLSFCRVVGDDSGPVVT